MILNSANEFWTNACVETIATCPWARNQCNLLFIKVNHWACHILNFSNFLFKMAT